MIMKKSLLLFFALSFIFASNAFAQETFTHKEAGVQFTVPGDWYYEQDGEMFSFYPKDKDITVYVTVAENKEIDALAEEMVKFLEENYKEIDLGKVKEIEAGGMKGFETSGSAIDKESGDKVYIIYELYITPKNKVLEFCEVGFEEVIKKYEADLEIIDNSLKPIE